jgi:hypothetical protein
MTTDEIVKQLRDIADLLEKTRFVKSTERPPGGVSLAELAKRPDALKPPPPPASPGPGEQVIDLSFVKIGETSSGKASLRIGYKNAGGETVYLSCFDEAIVDANRDLRKGMTCAIRTKPWKDTYVVTSLKVVDSEIPF